MGLEGFQIGALYQEPMVWTVELGSLIPYQENPRNSMLSKTEAYTSHCRHVFGRPGLSRMEPQLPLLNSPHGSKVPKYVLAVFCLFFRTLVLGVL